MTNTAEPQRTGREAEMESVYNRSARKSGGYRPARFNLPNLSREDLEILAQEALIRKEYGEEGVKRFWEAIPVEEGKP
jgi:hypothetical protein